MARLTPTTTTLIVAVFSCDEVSWGFPFCTEIFILTSLLSLAAATTPWGEPCAPFGTCERKHQCRADGGTLGERCGLGYCCLCEFFRLSLSLTTLIVYLSLVFSAGAAELTTTRLKRAIFNRPNTLASPISYFVQARSNLVCQVI